MDEVITILREVLYLSEDEVSPETELDTLIEDSMDAIELIAVLGDRYDASIEPDEMEEIETVQDLIEYVEANKGTGSGDALEAL